MPDSAPAPIRFHLDEQMDPDIAVALRRTGIDVTTTLEQGRPGQPDDAQFDYCVQTGRVIVTDDTDLLAWPPPHRGTPAWFTAAVSSTRWARSSNS